MGDYVEVERGTLIENKDKLKVVVVPQMISPHQSTDSSIGLWYKQHARRK